MSETRKKKIIGHIQYIAIFTFNLHFLGKDTPPALSLYAKGKEPKPNNTPAPGDYNPEKSASKMDNSPKYTFGLKTQVGKPVDTPGKTK